MHSLRSGGLTSRLTGPRRVEEDAARDRVRKIQNELAVVGFDLSHTGIVLLSYNSDGNTTEQGAHDR